MSVRRGSVRLILEFPPSSREIGRRSANQANADGLTRGFVNYLIAVETGFDLLPR